MKKITSLILILSLLASAALVLTSCKKGEELNPAEICVKSEEEAVKYYAAAQEKTDFADMDISSTYSSLALLTPTETADAGEVNYIVYNGLLDKIVFKNVKEADDAESAVSELKLSSYNGEDFFIVVKRDKNYSYTSSLYAADGTFLADKEYNTSSVYDFVSNYNYIDDGLCIEVNGDTYLIKDGVTSIVDSFAGFPDYDYSSEDYYYAIKEKEVFVYNKEFVQVAYYKAPEKAERVYAFVMADGNVIVQYMVALPEEAKKYDIYESGASGYNNGYAFSMKYELESLIFKVDSGKTKSIDLDFIIEEVENATVNDEYSDYINSENVLNYATILPIEDKRVGSDSADKRYVSLGNNGKIEAYLDKVVDGQSGIPTMIADNKYIVDDRMGNTFLVDGDGDVIKNISNLDYVGNGIFKTGTKYYNASLELVFDAKDYTLVSGNLYSKKDGEVTKYYTFDGTLKEIAESGEISNVSAGTVISYDLEADGKNYKVYRNYNGSEIFRVEIEKDDTYYPYVNASYLTDTIVFVVYDRVQTDAGYEYPSKIYVSKK